MTPSGSPMGVSVKRWTVPRVSGSGLAYAVPGGGCAAFGAGGGSGGAGAYACARAMEPIPFAVAAKLHDNKSLMSLAFIRSSSTMLDDTCQWLISNGRAKPQCRVLSGVRNRIG